jgi:two-component system, chemotaxis family, chemotaxis protein CheY
MPRDNQTNDAGRSPRPAFERSGGRVESARPGNLQTRSQGSSPTGDGRDESTKNQVTDSKSRQFVPPEGGARDRASRDAGARPQERLILVVEDDPDLREALAIVLEAEGHAVVQAPDGREAAHLIEDGLRPSLIVLDIAMPEMDGHEFREWQLEDRERAAVPAIGYSGVADPERASQLLGIPVFRKPAELGEVIRMVNRGCEVRRY